MTLLQDQPRLIARLRTEAEAHEVRVREALLAYRTGELDAPSTLRACGLELHSIKGAASLLGMLETYRVVGHLSESMMSARVQPDDAFWADFERWFGLLVRDLSNQESPHRASRTEQLTTIRTELERALGASPAVAFESPAPPMRGNTLAPSAGRRLLIIEDSATVRAALSARLGQRGYPVECAGDLMTVAEKLREFDPEIVVCDVHMPGVEGDEVCRRIKSHMRRLVPVILYSSLGPEELAERARRGRADGWVSKAQGIEALIERMDELLSEEILF